METDRGDAGDTGHTGSRVLSPPPTTGRAIDGPVAGRRERDDGRAGGRGAEARSGSCVGPADRPVRGSSAELDAPPVSMSNPISSPTSRTTVERDVAPERSGAGGEETQRSADAGRCLEGCARRVHHDDRGRRRTRGDLAVGPGAGRRGDERPAGLAIGGPRSPCQRCRRREGDRHDRGFESGPRALSGQPNGAGAARDERGRASVPRGTASPSG
jgi:hypothetical protein